jgi:hypothetical protein
LVTMGGKWKHCRLSGRTSRCSRQGRHSGFLEYTVLPAGPAAELCRSATFADGDRTGDVRTGRAEFIRCDQGRTWSSSTAKQGARNFLSGWKILTEQKPLLFLRRHPYSPPCIPIRHDTLGPLCRHRPGGPSMLFDDPACFRFDRRGAGGGVLRSDAGAGQAAPRRGRPACAEGRSSFVAMVEFDLAARRRTTPMKVRPTDPYGAPCRPYGLAASVHEYAPVSL